MKSFFLLTSFAIISSATFSQQATPHLFDETSLKTDFQEFRHILENEHPRLYEYTSKKKFDSLFKSSAQKIHAAMTEREFQFFLLPLIAEVHCAHTRLILSPESSQYAEDNLATLPLKLYYVNNKIFVQCSLDPKSAIKPGAQILSINSITSDSIYGNYFKNMSADGVNKTYIYYQINSSIGLFPGMLDYPIADSFKLVYIDTDDSTKKTITLEGIKKTKYKSAFYQQKRILPLCFTIDSISTAVLTIPSFSETITDSFMISLENIFTKLKNQNIKSLIIDLRNNTGGSPVLSAELLRFVLTKPFIYFNKNACSSGYDKYKKMISVKESRFRGEIYFLINGGCNSSTGHFLSLVRFFKRGMLIGEEAGSSYSCNGNGEPHVLTNTRLTLLCPHGIYETKVSGFKRGNGIAPDIFITPSKDDIISNKDSVLLFAINKISTINRK